MRRREPSPENVMRGRLLIMAVAALVAAACAEVAPVEPEIGFEAQAYLNEALDAGAIAATADPWISQGRPVVALLTDARRGRTQCVRPRFRRGARALGCYSSSETVTFTITTGSLG